MSKPYRLAVLNTHPIQYFAPLYAYLSGRPLVRVTALYCSDVSLRGAVDPGFKLPVKWDIDLLTGYEAKFLGPGASRRTPRGFWSLICPEIWTEIRSGRYDALLVHGHNYASTVIAMVAAKAAGLPILMRCETHLGLKRPQWRAWLRNRVLAFAYKWIDAFLAIGTGNLAYYRSLNVPESKIHLTPYSVDNERFIAAATIGARARIDVRLKMGLSPEIPVVLYASKLMSRKHPDDVIRAVAAINASGTACSLLMVGTGEMEGSLKELAEELGLSNVVFGGFINQAELPRIFAASDIFVLPSEDEPWGLVVNEAMCAGLPVIVSREVGCVADLVREGINGRLTNAGDVKSLIAAIEPLVKDRALREMMGAASLAIINRWGYEEARNGILQALRQSVRMS